MLGVKEGEKSRVIPRSSAQAAGKIMLLLSERGPLWEKALWGGGRGLVGESAWRSVSWTRLLDISSRDGQGDRGIQVRNSGARSWLKFGIISICVVF